MKNSRNSEEKSTTGQTKLKNRGTSKMKWTDTKEKIIEKFWNASTKKQAEIIETVTNQADDTNISIFPIENFNEFFKKIIGENYLKLAKMIYEASQYEDFSSKFSWACYDNNHDIITTVDDPTELIERYINSDDDIIETIAQNEKFMKNIGFTKNEIAEIKESYRKYREEKVEQTIKETYHQKK